VHARQEPVARTGAHGGRRKPQDDARRRSRARVHARRADGTWAQRRSAEPGPVTGQQSGPATAGRRADRPVVQDRQHELLQRLHGEPEMKAGSHAVIAVLLIAAPAAAQSPNTAALVVVVNDQTGAVVPGADIDVLNIDTG